MTATTPSRTTNSNANAPAAYTGFERLFIGGRWVTGRSEHKLQVINPYTQQPILEIPAADKRNLDEAYQQAQHAQIAWAEV
ncbi:MAG: aldehyde dehydrogenase family protein [Aulosira sp. DedQUE10]|nr:aldehyde dehydrogenase family protein [Aulosira sp. DedQUE10]